MDIVILEICKEGRHYFLQGIVKNEIKPILVKDIGYTTDMGKDLLDWAFNQCVYSDGIGGHLRQFTFKKQGAENLLKVLTRKDIQCLIHGKEYIFAGEG